MRKYYKKKQMTLKPFNHHLETLTMLSLPYRYFESLQAMAMEKTGKILGYPMQICNQTLLMC